MTEKMIDNITVNRWMDLTALCVLVDMSADRVGYRSRYHDRFLGVNLIEFDLGEGSRILKKGKGLLARYKVIAPQRL